MSIFAISDLHLSLAKPKPMDIFGDMWLDHHDRIADAWAGIVSTEDTVLVAGDHSWALRFDEAQLDLDFIARRPGKKILIRGNHDYWWRREATNKLQSKVDSSIYLMHGRGIVVDNIGITGTRGWRLEEGDDAESNDARVVNRELMYLERGLQEIPENVERKIVMLHYPPFDSDMEPNQFAEMLQAYHVDVLVYGHIHGGTYLEGDVNGIQYHLVAVDHTDFRPVMII